MKLRFLKIQFLFLLGCFTSCDTVKRVADNEHLLTDTNVYVNDKKDNSETINNIPQQKPNSKILGFPLRLHIYNTARPNIDSIIYNNINKSEKHKRRLEKFLSKKQLDKYVESRIGFNDWIKKTGEAPVIVDNEKTKKSVKRLEDYYINHGWFDVKASYDIKTQENKRAQIDYSVKTGKAFLIDSVTQKIASPVIDSIYKKSIKPNALIKTGEQYKTTNFDNERNRITTELRNSGVFHFKQDYITMEIDTIGTNKKVNVDIQIQNRAIRYQDSIKRVPFDIHKIKDVNIITDYAFENIGKPFQDSITYNHYKLYSYNKMRYRPKAITDAIFIAPGNVFKDIDRTRTYRHLNELRTFKYPNIEYIENGDNTLNSVVSLSPLKKFNLGFSTEVSHSNIQSVGVALNPSLLIRNIFRGAEILEVSARGSIGSSKEKNNPTDPFFDINEIGFDLKLTIPRLFLPINTDRIVPKYMSPSTFIKLSSSSQTNIGLDKQSFSGNLSYNWSPNSTVRNRLDLFNVQYVRNLNVDNYFDVYKNSYNSLNQIAKDVNYVSPDNDLTIPEGANDFISYATTPPLPNDISDDQRKVVTSIGERKNRLTENNLIFSSSYGLVVDARTNLFDEEFFIFRFKLELAGNLLSNISKLFNLEKNESNRYEIFNVAYSQYVKTELDYVKHWDLGKKNIFATRSYFGIAIPYGNSPNIPFAKSFFAGGSNDNRAWTPYNLGPGSSQSLNEFNEANLKIALSAEQRFHLFGDLYGAIFADAGNIWNVFDNTTTEGAVFKGFESLKDMALGTGFGLRYDFNFFVFRFDIGFKTYDPSYPLGQRWFNDYNFNNAVYNIGINYPF